jgi:hypothetical protein
MEWFKKCSTTLLLFRFDLTVAAAVAAFDASDDAADKDAVDAVIDEDKFGITGILEVGMELDDEAAEAAVEVMLLLDIVEDALAILVLAAAETADAAALSTMNNTPFPIRAQV